MEGSKFQRQGLKEDELGSSEEIPLEKFSSFIHPEELHLSTTESNPALNKHSTETTEEYAKLLENLAFLISGIEQMETRGLADRNLEEAKQWLPALVHELKSGQVKYRAILQRSALEKLPSFKVINSEIGFGCHFFDPKNTEKLTKATAELGEESVDYLNKEYLLYGIDKLKSLCKDYFEIEPEKFSVIESENPNETEHAVEKMTPPVDKDILKNKKIAQQPKLTRLIQKLVRATQNIVDVGSAIPKQILHEINGMLLFALLKIAPEQLGKLIWSQIMKKSDASQTPGNTPRFCDKFFPPLAIENIESQKMLSPYYLRLNEFNQYDPITDSFKKSENRAEKIKFEPSVSLHYLKTETRSVTLNTLELLHFPLKQETGELVALPMPLGINDDADNQFIPVSIEVVDNESGESKTVSIYYTTSGDYFFDRSEIPEDWEDVKIKFNHIIRQIQDREGNFRSEATVSEFITQNPKCFSEPKPEFDDGAQQVEFPKELSLLISTWSQLPSTEEKIEAVRNYFQENFSYPTKFFGSLRILLSEGTSNLHKILSAKEGNCYDTNRLAYIILQKIGVLSRLEIGIMPDENKKSLKIGGYNLPVADELQVGTTVGFEGDVAIYNPRDKGEFTLSLGGNHAFLRYYDSERKIWCGLDVTPSAASKSLLAHRKKWEHATLARQNLLDHIRTKNTLPQINSELTRRHPWLFRSKEKSFQEETLPFVEMMQILPPNTETSLEADSPAPYLSIPIFSRDKDITDPKLVALYEQKVLTEYRAYERLDVLAKKLEALEHQATEPVLAKLRWPVENFLKKHSSFIGKKMNLGEIVKAVDSVINEFVPSPHPGLLTDIRYDQTRNLFVLCDHYIRGTKESTGAYMNEQQVLDYASKIISQWSTAYGLEIPLITRALEAADSRQPIEEVLYQYQHPNAKRAELSAPERLSFDWLAGRDNASVENIDGKNETVLTDHETKKRYVVQEIKKK